MKKFLLTCLALGATAMTVSAESKVYLFDYLGDINGISDNGRYAAITDPDNGVAYLWNYENPEEIEDITYITAEEGLPDSEIAVASCVNDVTDDGMAVGSILFKDYHWKPAIYKDGEWSFLPVHPNSLNTNECIAVTPDGSVIGGYAMIKDPTADRGGKYYPCQWFLQEDGEYELLAYTDIELPNHQGFFPYTQTPDGKVLAGTVFCGVRSNINALIKDGELILFDEISATKECLEYKGGYYTGDDENGKPTWTEDPNDPNIVWFIYEYINGYSDGKKGDAGALNGFFYGCDDQGNLYGARTYTLNVDEKGNGDLKSNAIIYNYETDTWYDEEGVSAFSTGIGEELIFTLDGRVITGNKVESVQDAYDVRTDKIVAGINAISADGKTLGGVMAEFNEAISDYMYYPFIVEIDGGANAGVQSIAGSPKKGLVIVTSGRIEVVNADAVAVYDLDGRLISTERVTDVQPGIYVVKAGEESYKVCVK